jgi:hypothetical protein
MSKESFKKLADYLQIDTNKSIMDNEIMNNIIGIIFLFLTYFPDGALNRLFELEELKNKHSEEIGKLYLENNILKQKQSSGFRFFCNRIFFFFS